MSNLTTPFLNQTLPTPLVLASGDGARPSTCWSMRSGCSLVTARSCGPSRCAPARMDRRAWTGAAASSQRHRPGQPRRRTKCRCWPRPKTSRLAPLGVPLIASIFAGPARGIRHGGGHRGPGRTGHGGSQHFLPQRAQQFGEPYAASADAAAEVTGHVVGALRETGIPVIVKLAPNVPSIRHIAGCGGRRLGRALCRHQHHAGDGHRHRKRPADPGQPQRQRAVPPSSPSPSNASTTCARPARRCPSSARAA
ncbi:MAG: hypothetical protein R2838_06540 [Caldilineaceae bacterium]